jgi:hypothetical protein
MVACLEIAHGSAKIDGKPGEKFLVQTRNHNVADALRLAVTPALKIASILLYPQAAAGYSENKGIFF